MSDVAELPYERLVAAALAIITLLTMIGVGWVGAHKTQAHRDAECAQGVTWLCDNR